MKYILALLLITACTKEDGVKGTNGETGKDGKSISGPKGDSCTVSPLPQGALITCQDGTSSIIYNGMIGSIGLDGKSCSVLDTNDGAIIMCQDGTSVEIKDGESITGPTGPSGNDGINSVTSLLDVLPSQGCVNGGTMFSVGLDINRNNVLDVNEVVHASLICNGTNGQNAIISPFTPVDIIDPCGDTPNQFDEILIRLANGMILADISKNMSGDYTRLGIIPSGNWITTDETNCHFTVLSNGTVTW